MALNPFQDSEQRTRRAKRNTGLTVGIVIARSAENHSVAVREVTDTGDPQTETKPMNGPVAVQQRGDAALPDVGDMVIVARFQSTAPIILGTYYTQQDQIPSDAAVRRVSGSEGLTLDGPWVEVPKRTDDPSTLSDGIVYYREDLDEYRGVEDGNIVTFNTTQV